MSKKARRFLCGLMCGMLFLTSAAASASRDEGFVMAGFDGDESRHRWETNGFFARMESRTGVRFTFQEYTDYAGWQEAKAAMFGGGALPDVLFKAALTTDELIRYTDSGQLIDLKPLLAENAPHVWALLSENPRRMAAVTLPSGKIGALPALSEQPAQNAMWINRRWLDNLKLPLPESAEELQKTLTAFRDGDPNQNGKKDEIPLGFLGVWDLKFLAHAFGVAVNDYHLYVDEGGQARFWPMEESFWRLAEYLRGLQTEKLLDPGGFYTVDMLRTNNDKDADPVYGCFFGPSPMTLYPYDQAGEYTLLPPLRYAGKQMYRDLADDGVVRGVFAITSACQDPAALLRWVDFLYTEEGAVLAMAGEEGVDYYVGEDGRWQWSGGMESMTPERWADVSLYDTGDMPWLFPLEFHGRFAEENVARLGRELETLQGLIVKPFPAYSLTPEQRSVLLPLQNSLGPYVDECLARLVLGQQALSGESRAGFEAGLKERGLDQFLAFWQSVLDGLT